MAFANRLKEARKKSGLTQEQLGEKIGVAKSTIAGYERGSSEPDIAKLDKIMQVLDIDANFLFYDEVHKLSEKQDQLDLTSHQRKVILAYKAQPEMQPPVDKLLGVEEEPEIEPAPEPETIAKEQETPEEEEEYVEVFSAAMSNPDAKGGYATPGMIKMKKSDVEKLLNAPETKRNF